MGFNDMNMASTTFANPLTDRLDSPQALAAHLAALVALSRDLEPAQRDEAVPHARRGIRHWSCHLVSRRRWNLHRLREGMVSHVKTVFRIINNIL